MSFIHFHCMICDDGPCTGACKQSAKDCKAGFISGIKRAQLVITQDKELKQEDRIRLWNELEKKITNY